MIYNFATNLSYGYWSQERTLFSGSLLTDTVGIWSNLHGSQAEPIATFIPDANGDVLIDVTDYLRTYGAQLNAQVTLYFINGANTYTHAMTNMGLISPNSVLAPESEIGQNFGLKVFAPSVMLAPITAGAPIIFELSNESEYQFATGRVKQLPSEAVANFARENTLAVTTTEVEFWHLTDAKYGSVNVKDLDDCKNYVAVEWVSFTGVKRRHTFEVRKCKVTTDGAFDLLGIENEYIRIKGRVDGFDLYLDELNDYDIWYYSDVVTSSDVRVSFDGTNWARVEVTEKSYTIPDGEAEKNGSIQISVNWKKYDAVSM